MGDRLKKFIAHLSIIASSLICSSPASAQIDQPYALQTFSGPLTVAAHVPLVAVTKNNLTGTTPPKDCESDTAQVQADFAKLDNANPSWKSQFGAFVSLLPCNRNVAGIAAGQLQTGASDDLKLIDVWGPGPFGSLAVKRKNTLTSVGANAAFAPDPARRNFIGLPGPGGAVAYVPQPIAYSAEASFINGLVTRLMLGRVKTAVGINSQVPSPGSATWATDPLIYESSSTWGYGDYDKSLRETLAAHPLQADAIISGWIFAEQIEKTKPDVQDAVLNLLAHRFTTKQLGEAVGYTLSYLQGYKETRATAAVTDSNIILSDLKTVLLNQSGSIQDKSSTFDPRTINDKFFSAVAVGQFDYHSSGSENAIADFLIGYNEGGIRSAEVVFADVYLLGYGKGYSDGFINGYATGFAEGERQAAAHKNFFEQLNVFVGQVAHVTDNVRAISGNVATISSNVAKVVAVVSAIFG